MKPLRIALVLVALAVLAAVPWFGSDVLIQFGINALLLAVLAQGWNIIGGYTGYASFGNSVFYGLGSYGVAIAMVQWQSAVRRRPRCSAWCLRSSSPFSSACRCCGSRATTSPSRRWRCRRS